MDFQDAIRKIEERGDFNRFAEVKPIFETRLDELKPGDFTERGLCYYYLLISYLKADLVHETMECIEFYEKMCSAFEKQEKVYREEHKKFSWSEIKDFFRLMDRCYGSLEFLYHKHDFKRRRLDALERKMAFRKDACFFDREYLRWFEYKMAQITSLYGTSLYRWAITTAVFTFFMALAYMTIDQFVAEELRTVAAGAGGHWFDYIYFSMITITTVGYGEIVPIALAAKMLAVFEAFVGFLMLGIFINLIQKKL